GVDGGDRGLEASQLPGDLEGALLVFPQVGRRRQPPQRLDLTQLAVDVKGTSGRRRAWLRVP
ncbi:MAG: hypothetical protein M3404_11220, partial [Actinomycetota bacterium]|nr:hypothetical protein [Actinomycetota bacterium]